jgi:hypothetical protein
VIAGLAGFVGLVALLHVLRADDLPPADHFISEYARGDLGWVMAAAFGCWAVSLALLARGWRGVVRWALAVAAVGALGAGLFTTQTVAGMTPPGVERTFEGRAHDRATLLIFGGLLVAAVGSAVAVRRLRLPVALLALALLAVVPVLVALGLDAPGIGQRGFVLVGVAWQALATREARATRAGPAAARGRRAPPGRRARRGSTS